MPLVKIEIYFPDGKYCNSCRFLKKKLGMFQFCLMFGGLLKYDKDGKSVIKYVLCKKAKKGDEINANYCRAL